ncbi:DNA-binding response regulator [Bacillus sp. FJAT-42376]|uniref:response regulator n=1 Tax=Bacillus sp. FJAT-42376 TaxID=2014076 RepID=UPI000F510BE6|nr:response regulator transcription factor [Bacillus sp. FJAT-42376]AZB41797.1 DNA-binding response regulator [Bacillus sp. FJAT-42376]
MINIVVVNGSGLLRESLVYLIEKDSELHVTGCAENQEQTLALCSTLAPDVILIDIEMPGCDVFETAKQIKHLHSAVKVIFLASQADKKSGFFALKSGADGYLLKNITGSELILAIKCAANHMKIFHPMVFKVMEDEWMNTSESHPPDNLTIREMELIKYIAQGKSNKEIAKLLFLSEGRVKNIVTGILKKSALQHRTQLAVYAIKKRYI